MYVTHPDHLDALPPEPPSLMALLTATVAVVLSPVVLLALASHAEFALGAATATVLLTARRRLR